MKLRFISVPLALLAVACNPTFATELRVPGAAEAIPYDRSAGVQVASLSRTAAAALRCEELSVERKAKSEIFRARGCGRQILYVRLLKIHQKTYTYGFSNGVVYHETLDWVPLAALSPDSGLAPDSPIASTLAALVRLNMEAAKDLECPRTDVVPELASVGRGGTMPIAEGCGRRAMYLPTGDASALRFAGRVDAPDAPTGFVRWDGSDR